MAAPGSMFGRAANAAPSAALATAIHPKPEGLQKAPQRHRRATETPRQLKAIGTSHMSARDRSTGR